MRFSRWKGKASIVLVIALIVCFIVLFLDNIIKSVIENQGSKKLGTKIEIGSVSTSFFSQSAELKNLAIANPNNPMENIMAIDLIKIQIDGTQVFYKKVIINEMTVLGIRFYKPRKIPAKKVNKAPNHRRKTIEVSKIKPASFSLGRHLSFPSPEEILKLEKLQTLKQANAVKKNIEILKTKWKARFKSNLKVGFSGQIQKRIDTLKQKLKESAGRFSRTPAAIQEAQDIKKDIEVRVQIINDLQNKMQTDFDQTKQMLTDLKNLPQRDLQRLKNKYSLDTKGGVKLLGLVIGKQTKEMFEKFKYHYDRLSPYLREIDTKESLEDERTRGKDAYIKFKEMNAYPNFLIKLSKLSANIMDIAVIGELKNFSNNQKVYGKPATFFISSQQNEKFDALEVQGKIDRTQNEAEDSINFDVKSLKLNNIALGDGIRIQGGSADIQNHLKILSGKNLAGQVNVDLTSIVMSFPEQQNNETTQLISQALSSIDKFYVKANLSGTLAKQTIDAKTNLDKTISQTAKKILSKNVKEFETNLKQLILSTIAEPLNQTNVSGKEFLGFDKTLTDQTSSLNTQWKQAKDIILSQK